MRSLIVPVVLLLAAAPFAAAAADPLPTAEEIHQLYDKAQYAQMLQKLQRVLVLKGEAAKAYDRHDLLRLKGEAQLRIKAAAPAAQAFAEAADEAPNAEAAAVDRATALLVKRSSQQFTYTPKVAKEKGKTPEAIHILDAELRKQALGALFRDEYTAAAPRIEAARESRQVSTITAVVPTVRDLRSLEIAATGGDADMKKLVGEMGKHAQKLLSDAVHDLVPPVEDIEKRANQYVQFQQPEYDARGKVTRTTLLWKKKGLMGQDATVLRTTYGTCEKVAAACRDLADALGDGAADFGAVRTEAGKLARRADAALNADYSRVHATKPDQ